jgi:hypothetical protein
LPSAANRHDAGRFRPIAGPPRRLIVDPNFGDCVAVGRYNRTSADAGRAPPGAVKAFDLLASRVL